LYVVARSEALIEDIDEIAAWRTPEQQRLIWIEGCTTGYRVDPVGEFVIGVATGPSYRLQYGRRDHTVKPHQLVVLDPSRDHSGKPVATEPWEARLLVIELRTSPPATPASISPSQTHSLAVPPWLTVSWTCTTPCGSIAHIAGSVRARQRPSRVLARGSVPY